MDSYQSAQDILLQMDQVRSWPELQSVFARAASRRRRAWELPMIACEAVGGSMAQGVRAMAVIACAQISILLVDDLLDDDPRGEQGNLGLPATANLALAFQAAAVELLLGGDFGLGPTARRVAVQRLNGMALTVAFGQYLDSQNITDEKAYWQLVGAKSAAFFGAALQVGALLGGASESEAGQLWNLGCLCGEMIQIHDDLHDAMEIPANPDWRLGRASLPLLYAQMVDHLDRERFLQLRPLVADLAALNEAQAILIRCGAISYGVDELLKRYTQGQRLLETLPAVQRAKLAVLLEEQIQPVRALLAELGEPLTVERGDSVQVG